MAINNPIIAADSTVSRAEVKTVIGLISPVEPPGDYIVVVDGSVTLVDLRAEREGQMVFVLSDDDLSVTPYVAVITNADGLIGALEWKRVFTSGVTEDPRTGQPKDSLSGFYTYS